MNNQASSFRADRGARPWYRDRWPWLLLAGPAIAVVGSLASAWLAVTTDDGVVANDYYKQGLLINRRLAAVPTAADPGAMVVVGNDGRVRVRLTYNGAAPSRVQLTLFHPGDPRRLSRSHRPTTAFGSGAIDAPDPGQVDRFAGIEFVAAAGHDDPRSAFAKSAWARVAHPRDPRPHSSQAREPSWNGAC